MRDYPGLLGYYTDNEMGWWNGTLFKMTLEQPARSGQRQRLVKLLREAYRVRKEPDAEPPSGDGDVPVEEAQAAARRSYDAIRRRCDELDAFGAAHVLALPAIRTAEEDPVAPVRVAACDAERRITGDVRPLVAECARQIDDDRFSYRALGALPAAGPGASAAIRSPQIGSAAAEPERRAARLSS